MRKLISLLFIAAFLPLLVLTSCREDEDPDPVAKTEYDVLTEYMTTNTMDLADVLSGWVTSGGGLTVDPVDFSVADYYIMDFRNATDFAAGHIKDANNVVFADLLTAAPADKSTKILCVCYTGQTASRATGILRLAGYANAKNLKWGMCGWHSDFETKWESNAGDYASANWTTTGTPTAATEFDAPSFTTGNTDGAAILSARIQAAIALPWTVSKTDVLANPSNYFVNNYWPEESWTEYGHVSGAYRINELGIAFGSLSNLNASEEIVTYCYTGQTSAIITAWLHVLGYNNAKSMLFGANAITHSALLTGGSGSAPAKSWKGVGSGSELNFGYYDSTDLLHPPL